MRRAGRGGQGPACSAAAAGLARDEPRGFPRPDGGHARR
ncbi:hypothetical protein BMAPRL20_1091 [Burkholderia mallei PRL-20]|uniref:Uncharacterized protein n=1 Tax=Burkholderia pseudomallei (strain 1106a) TaxID=357348 RepID=A3P4G6_BURP0|nr:hypothetical protein BURPS668_A1265 [Burkholderia pseudomallei 668]ABN94606.1 hypothetical protein BURPS1106A_A1191 [Burkholderia pseudomallei 1106a]ABO02701.1 hypothetical protein BMA10247_A0933 [Burkholderia mallei NCTC 10247]AFR19136.1 hypothetical protein BPC006_II1208 [Burkholderia pseudomallei BPC006]EBA49427.1 hypothetical protein BURPS305_5230 [Burkholderia pseudomallei 305]EDK55520.1 hypothetical protein BMAFMH_E0588 [Burkholderia mallei FMH]EDK61453.1 hypothetical protein BMAJHU_